MFYRYGLLPEKQSSDIEFSDIVEFVDYSTGEVVSHNLYEEIQSFADETNVNYIVNSGILKELKGGFYYDYEKDMDAFYEDYGAVGEGFPVSSKNLFENETKEVDPVIANDTKGDIIDDKK